MKYREVIPLKQRPSFQINLPGSKSITNRMFLCAALARGKSRIYGALKSDDADVMLKALKKVGVKIREIENYIEITGAGGEFKKGKVTLDLHNAGTATRFLTAIMTLRDGETIITGDKRMKERPIKDLADGLVQLGASVEYLKKRGCPPLRIHDSRFMIHELKEYLIKMKGDKSSQYFSALLMLGPMLDKPLKIEVVGDLASKPYIDVTLNVLKQFGIKVQNNSYRSFIIKPQVYKSGNYTVEGDASAASYWTSIAYLHGGDVKFNNLTRHSIQGDIKYGEALNRLMPRESFAARAIDMSDMPDSAMTLAAITPFIKNFSVGKQSRTTITGLSTLRIKETDRLKALGKELKKIGVNVSTTKDSITIQGLRTQDSGLRTQESGLSRNQPCLPAGRLCPVSRVLCPIKTYDDHRMAMCFAVVGTLVPGITIESPGCVDKTYPNFWKDLELAYMSPIDLGQKNLILTGMRCSGKTCLGKKIAKLLNREFIDLDDEIEKYENMKIKDMIKNYGWPSFRKTEQKMCSFFGRKNNLVIATGGGVVLSEKNMENLKRNGINVFIFADTSTIISRLKRKSVNRPTLTGKGTVKEIQNIWKERRDLYLKYADIVWDNSSGEIVEKNLEQIFN
jgi:3-phosphoshikimate 1-carboxyvinyltransferase